MADSVTSPTEPAHPNARIEAAAITQFWLDGDNGRDTDRDAAWAKIAASEQQLYRDDARQILAAADAAESSDAEKLREALRSIVDWYENADDVRVIERFGQLPSLFKNARAALAVSEPVSSPEAAP